MDFFKLNRAMAYQGRIGKKREAFCTAYISRKQAIIKDIERDMLEQVNSNGETITCRKGCSSCCVVYIEAGIKECEAIVYYLYRNQSASAIFLEQYLRWIKQLADYGDLSKRCEQALRERRAKDAGYDEETERALADALLFYKMQNIHCPFLYDQICIIHEVRPFTCALHFATTPAEWCHPLNPGRPMVYKAATPDEMFDLSFYYGKLSEPVFSFMPLTVYEIMKSGYSYLSGIQGLETLASEAMNDPEIRAILENY